MTNLLTLAPFLLVAAFAGGWPTAHAQDTTPALAALSGTAYELVDQTIVDGIVIDETQVPVTNGRIAIPELGTDQPLLEDGSFSFSDLPVSADPNNPTEVTVIFTAPGLGSFTFLHLRLYPGPVGPILTPQLIDIPRVDDLARERGTGGPLPATGTGHPVGDTPPFAVVAILALLGATLGGLGLAGRYATKAA